MEYRAAHCAALSHKVTNAGLPARMNGRLTEERQILGRGGRVVDEEQDVEGSNPTGRCSYGLAGDRISLAVHREISPESKAVSRKAAKRTAMGRRSGRVGREARVGVSV